jgi:hypothetical protein
MHIAEGEKSKIYYKDRNNLSIEEEPAPAIYEATLRILRKQIRRKINTNLTH